MNTAPFVRSSSLWDGKYGYIVPTACVPKTDLGAHFRYISTSFKIRTPSGRRGDIYTFRGLGDNLDDAISFAKKMERVMERRFDMRNARRMDWEAATLREIAEDARATPYRASVTTRNEESPAGADPIAEFLNVDSANMGDTNSSFAEGAMFGMLLAKYGYEELCRIGKQLKF